MKFFTLVCCAALFFPIGASAQKGAPPKKVTAVSHVYNYAQAKDFKPAMINQLKVPAGWKVSIAAGGLGKPRTMRIGKNNELYVTRRDNGDVLMLKDTNMDGKFDKLAKVAFGFKGVHGIEIKDDKMYLLNDRELRRYDMNPDGTLGMMAKLIDDLPDGGQHPNRTMAFGPDGMLYISIGSTCNDCYDSNPENATMLVVDPATWKRKIYARGLRNTIGFDFHPQTGELWGADNGGDGKGDAWPPEEINNIKKDKHYGWPVVYSKQVPDETREDPPNVTKAEFAKMTEPSVLDLTPHMAPIEFKFFGTGASVPSSLRGDALVTWHGSWNSSKPVGFKVQHVRFENGRAVKAEDFLTGFVNPAARERIGRPAGIAISPDGKIFISDDASGNIYLITQQ